MTFVEKALDLAEKVKLFDEMSVDEIEEAELDGQSLIYDEQDFYIDLRAEIIAVVKAAEHGWEPGIAEALNALNKKVGEMK